MMIAHDSIEVEGVSALRGSVVPPGDKSISHRALLLAALAEGSSEIRGLSRGEDVSNTAAAIAALGAEVTPLGRTSSPNASGVDLLVKGGRGKLGEPERPLECGNSGTSMRLLCGMVSSIPGLFLLCGDSSLSKRPMGRVLEPLAAMGARVDGRQGGQLPPLAVRGGDLQGRHHRLAVASAQVKGALLLAGLSARGTTVVEEPGRSRAHTEEMLALAGVEVQTEDRGAARVISVRSAALSPFDIHVAADPSQAAFWVVAALVVPQSEITVKGVYPRSERTGFLAVLRRMGAQIETVEVDDQRMDITARHSELCATDITEEEVPGLIDEVPILAVAASFAKGTSHFAGGPELRVKESDRVATTVGMLSAFGVGAKGEAWGIQIEGNAGAGLHAGSVDSHGDHRIAMAAAVAAAATKGTSRISGWRSVATSYPGFEDDFVSLGGRAG